MTAVPKTVLFLSINGVLQTPALGEFLEMEVTEGLSNLLRSMPHLKIVVSSTLREGKPLGQLKAMFPDDIAERVIGATPRHVEGRAYGGKQLEIEDWLSQNGADHWVAVDDSTLLFKPGCPWLVTTHPWVGWTDQTTEDARALLDPEFKKTLKTTAPPAVSSPKAALPEKSNTAGTRRAQLAAPVEVPALSFWQRLWQRLR